MIPKKLVARLSLHGGIVEIDGKSIVCESIKIDWTAAKLPQVVLTLPAVDVDFQIDGPVLVENVTKLEELEKRLGKSLDSQSELLDKIDSLANEREAMKERLRQLEPYALRGIDTVDEEQACSPLIGTPIGGVVSGCRSTAVPIITIPARRREQ